MKQILLYLFLLTVATVPAQNPVISTIISEVKIDSLLQTVRDISGENEVQVNGLTDTIRSRHITQPGNYLAFHYLYHRLISYGLQVDSNLFTYNGQTGQNIVATLPGQLHPNQYYIICAHYDGMPTGTYGPGADDNGSGVGTVLEAARLLSQHSFEYTVVFALWDIEEQGLRGSAAYALAAQTNGDSLLGVLNMDAIAWDGDNDGLARIHTRPVANSVALADSMLAWNSTYGLNINFAINNPGATYSDHASFWNRGFSAVLLIEDFDNDGNPHYHTNTDKMEYFTQPYYLKLAQMAITTTASLAVPYSPPAVVQETGGSEWGRSYPNPFEQTLQLQYSRLCILLQVQLMNSMGTVVLQDCFSHTQSLLIDGSQLPAGVYQLLVEADGSRHTQRVVKL